MHEMSIATSILDIAEKEARDAKANRVNSIEISLGQLAGVEVHSLEFCFEVARKSSPLTEAAELIIHEVPGRGTCGQCKAEVDVDFFVALCPECGEGRVEITQGRELKVQSLNVD